MRVVRMTGPDETTGKVIEKTKGLVEITSVGLEVAAGRMNAREAGAILSQLAAKESVSAEDRAIDQAATAPKI